MLAIAAPLFILATPFVKFIVFRGYGLAHLEVGIVFAFLAVAALAIFAVIMLRPETLRPCLLGLMILTFGYGEFGHFGLTLPVELESGSILANLVNGSMIALPFGIVMTGTWVLKRHINFIIVTSFGVIMITTILIPPEVSDTWRTRTGTLAARSPKIAPTGPLPPVLHIVLDGQIGINGLPPEIAGSQALGRELRAFYKGFGFRLYPSAFTHFSATVESIPNLLNGRVLPVASTYVEGEKLNFRLLKNAWFRHLAEKGYRIDVYQSEYLDFCAPGSDASTLVDTCNIYRHADVRFYHKINIAPLAKAKLLLAYVVITDFLPILGGIVFSYDLLRRWLDSIGVNLASWEIVAIYPAPLVSMDVMARLSRRMETLKDGEAVFAHLLVPHDPFLLDRRCNANDIDSLPERGLRLWAGLYRNTPERWAVRYRAYLEQVRCVHAKLGDILNKMRKSGILDRSIVIFHGDHGSRIALLSASSPNAGKLSNRDIIDNFSTHFAIKAPGLASGEFVEQRSIQDLFASEIAGWTGIKTHNDVFLKPDKAQVGPGQVRRPMVPMGLSAVNRANVD